MKTSANYRNATHTAPGAWLPVQAAGSECSILEFSRTAQSVPNGIHGQPRFR